MVVDSISDPEWFDTKRQYRGVMTKLRVSSRLDTRRCCIWMHICFSVGAVENDKKHDHLAMGSMGIRPHGEQRIASCMTPVHAGRRWMDLAIPTMLVTRRMDAIFEDEGAKIQQSKKDIDTRKETTPLPSFFLLVGQVQQFDCIHEYPSDPSLE